MASRPFQKEFLLGNSSTELALGLNANEALIVTSASVCNNDASSRALTMNLASDGGAASDTNKIESARVIAPGTAGPVSTALAGMVVRGGAKVYAHADTANELALSISGMVVPQT